MLETCLVDWINLYFVFKNVETFPREEIICSSAIARSCLVRFQSNSKNLIVGKKTISRRPIILTALKVYF